MDLISLGSIAVLLITILLFSTVLVVSTSTETSLKKFLDSNLMDSLDGDLRDYAPGDVVEITDTIHSISFADGYTSITMLSTLNTQYGSWGVLHVQGRLGDTYKAGERVKITLRIELSEDGRREVFAPILREDVVLLSPEVTK